jgi:hypothetical protein
MRTWLRWLTLALLVFGVAWGVVAQTEGGQNIAVIFDASGSMNAALGGSTRIAVARQTVADVVGGFPATTNTSLWVYGHRLPQDDPAASCQDIEQVISLSPVDAASYSATVSGINAIGYTPISDTLVQAAASLPPGENNTIVLISDGEETCSGDPCAVARALADGGVDVVVNTVGFAADEPTRLQLQCIAQVTGGRYFDAQDADALAASLQEAAVAQTGRVRLVDPDGEPLTDITFTLTNAETGEQVGTYTGSGQAVVGNYAANIRIRDGETQPVAVVAGETTDVVVVPVVLGAVQLVDRDGAPVEDLRFRVDASETGEYIGSFIGAANLPAGVYDVSVFSIIPVDETGVSVVEGETTPVVVNADTGTVRLVDAASGEVLAAPLFEVRKADGEYLGTFSESYDLPPGDYNIRPRAQLVDPVDVTVPLGETVDIPISTEVGTIRLVSAETGEVLADPLFEVRTASGTYLGTYSETYDVPPGDYLVSPRAQLTESSTVTVTAGGTVDVSISTAAGTIRLVSAETGEVITEPLFEVYTLADNTYLGAYSGTFDVPPGDYVVSPRAQLTESTTITVAAGATTDVPLSTAVGTIRLVDEGTGEMLSEPLFEVRTADGEYLGAYGGMYDVPPGDYVIMVRNLFRDEFTVTVATDATSDVVLNTDAGTIQLVDGGAVITEPLFEVYTLDDDNTYLGAHAGTFDLPPGEYRVRVRRTDDTELFDVNVLVNTNEVTSVDFSSRTTDKPVP